jgi:hypothetical protein
MGAVLKYVVSAVAGLGVFVLGSTFITSHMRWNRPATEASAVYFKMAGEAWQKYPQEQPLVALAKYSHEAALKEMDAAKDEATRRKIAATIFLGYYLDNGRARGEFCNKYGVDTSSFVSSFENRHAALRARALAVLEDDGALDDIYDSNSRAMLEHVSYEMLYLDSSALGLKDACAKLVERPYAYLPKMSFAEIEPAITSVLLSTPRDTGPVVASLAPVPVHRQIVTATAHKAMMVAAIAAHPVVPPVPLRRALID